MPKKRTTPNRPTDMNQLAHRLVAIATEQEEDTAPDPVPDAVQKRGTARAEALSPEKRQEIAKKAAKKRWNAKK